MRHLLEITGGALDVRRAWGRVARRLPPPPGGPLVSTRQATRRWLTDVLQRSVDLHGAKVARVELVDERWSATAVRAHLAVTYAGGAPAAAPTRLLLKVARSDIDPHLSAFGANEVDYYRTVGSAPGAVSPACYDAVCAPDAGHWHLLLDDLSATHVGMEPIPSPPLERCHQALDVLARVHAAWWRHPELGRGIGALPTPASFERTLADAASRIDGFAASCNGWLSAERRALLDRVLGALSMRREQLTGADRLTVIHGDAHFGNVLYPRDADRAAPRVIDWQFWRVGLGAGDVAYLVALHWYPERRRRFERGLVERYHRALLRQGVSDYEWEQCWDDYRMAVVFTLLVPIWQSSWRLDPLIWTNHWERIWLAFDDLDCRQLLGI